MPPWLSYQIDLVFTISQAQAVDPMLFYQECWEARMLQGQGILAIDMSLTQPTSLPQPSETSKPLLPSSSPSTRLVRSEHQHKKRPKQMLTSTIPKLLMTCVKTMKTKRPIGFNLPSLSWAAHALPLDQNDILNSEVGNLGPFGSEGGTWERKETSWGWAVPSSVEARVS